MSREDRLSELARYSRMTDAEVDMEVVLGANRDVLELRRKQAREAASGQTTVKIEEVVQGVSIPWLETVFKISAYHVKRKIADVKPTGFSRVGQPLYAVHEVAPRLIRLDDKALQAVLRDMKGADLPPALQPTIWEARLKRQKFELQAGELWPTQDVQEVFADVFNTIREKMKLWVDKLEKGAMTPQQQKVLQDLVDDLQSDIHIALVDMPRRRRTRSSIRALDDLEDLPSISGAEAMESTFAEAAE